MKNTAFFSMIFFSLLFTAIGCNKDEECPAPAPDTNNTETVKQLFGYFGKGDVNAYLNGHDVNCVFDITGNSILNPGKVYNGHAGFMQFLGDLSAKGQPTAINPTDFYESGDVVTATGNLTFKDLATGQTCTANFIQLWKFNAEGKVIYFKEDHDKRVCQ
jgi:ketosteroid isomerase-like protein